MWPMYWHAAYGTCLLLNKRANYMQKNIIKTILNAFIHYYYLEERPISHYWYQYSFIFKSDMNFPILLLTKRHTLMLWWYKRFVVQIRDKQFKVINMFLCIWTFNIIIWMVLCVPPSLFYKHIKDPISCSLTSWS